jgi:DNA polymerase I
MNTWLIIDVSYLCRRAYHAIGDALTFDDMSTGVIFGFLKEMNVIQQRYQTERVVFCFDAGLGLREQQCKTYKSSRRQKQATMTEEELKSLGEFRNQVKRLRTRYLRGIGYRNVFGQEGYEADDVIASIVQHSLPPGDVGVIVSADHDYLQLLDGGRVEIFNPHANKHVTLQSFHEQWGLMPEQWAKVLAIAGCSTDDVQGIDGVGEKTAAKFLRKELKPHTVAYQAIRQGWDRCKRNLKLVKLPLDGVAKFELVPDEVSVEGWEKFTEEMGFKSLREHAPFMIRGGRARIQGFDL